MCLRIIGRIIFLRSIGRIYICLVSGKPICYIVVVWRYEKNSLTRLGRGIRPSSGRNWIKTNNNVYSKTRLILLELVSWRFPRIRFGRVIIFLGYFYPTDTTATFSKYPKCVKMITFYVMQQLLVKRNENELSNRRNNARAVNKGYYYFVAWKIQQTLTQ